MNTTGTNPTNFSLSIDGMTCGHCVQAVTKVLVGVQGVGVGSVRVGSAEVTAPDALTIARAVAALDEAGYSARASKTPAENAAPAATGASCCRGSKRNTSSGGCCG